MEIAMFDDLIDALRIARERVVERARDEVRP